MNPFQEFVTVTQSDYDDFKIIGLFYNFEDAEKALVLASEQVKGSLNMWHFDQGGEHKHFVIKINDNDYYNFVVQKITLNSLKLDF